MKKDYSKLWVLFKSMFVLSACTFGGGIRNRFSHEEKICRRTKMAGRG